MRSLEVAETTYNLKAFKIIRLAKHAKKAGPGAHDDFTLAIAFRHLM
jgi:hypothetical protein